MSEQAEAQWYSVRCLFQRQTAEEGYAYEERLTLWQAASFDEAIALAEAEAAEYVVPIHAKYIKLAQAFHLFEPPAHGREVESLIRGSDLAPDEYLTAFFDTGEETTQRT